METIIMGSVCFFSYLFGFLLVFAIVGKYYLKKDNLLETHYASIRPGQFCSEDKQEKTHDEQQSAGQSVFLQQENDECNENISKKDDEADNKSEIGLCARIPRKDNSYTEFVANLSEEESFDESMKNNMRKENDAYKIIKRKRQENIK